MWHTMSYTTQTPWQGQQNNIHIAQYFKQSVTVMLFCFQYMLVRDAKGRKKEASKVKQTTKQSNTTHPRQSIFQIKMSCLGWDVQHNKRQHTKTVMPCSLKSMAQPASVRVRDSHITDTHTLPTLPGKRRE